MKNIKYIDIFSGCGGLSLGLHNAGLEGVFAIEKNRDAFNTLKTNLIDNIEHFKFWPDWLKKEEHDIKELIEEKKENLKAISTGIDLVVGGPPCQGFSMAGKRDSKDKRNKLVDYYINFIELIKPQYLFFENVRGFTTSTITLNKKKIFYKDYIINKLTNLGYFIESKIISMNNYGIPQKRERFILIGTLGKKIDFFEKLDANLDTFLKHKNISKYNTVEDAISDIIKENGTVICPDSKSFLSGKYKNAKSNYQKLMRTNNNKEIPDSHRFANQTEKIVNLQKYMLQNCNKGERITPKDNIVPELKRRGVTVLDPAKPSPTVTSHPDDFIHYCEPRILTVREMARLQSFPDSYIFKGKYTTGGKLRANDVPRFTQVGNAVPPLFAEQVGLIFREVAQDDKQ